MINWPAPPSGMGNEANWFRKLLSACRQTEILPGVGYRIKETKDGRILDILKQPAPPFTQVPGMYPFRVYQPPPSAFPNTVVAGMSFPAIVGTSFDNNGNPFAVKIDPTIPTNFSASPPTVNPKTDYWRLWMVRNGQVEIRPYYSSPEPSGCGFVGSASVNNFSVQMEVFEGTDAISPASGFETYDSYDASAIVECVQYSGFYNEYDYSGVIVVPGDVDEVGAIGFYLWIEITPDTDDSEFPQLRVKGRRWSGIIDDPYPDNMQPGYSPFIIPLAQLNSNGGMYYPYEPYDLLPVQLLSSNVFNRWPASMGIIPPAQVDLYSATNGGALSYRGNWDTDDIQDMVFYPGDVISVSELLSGTVSSTPVSFTSTLYGGSYVHLRNYALYMAQNICFTDNPVLDSNFIVISSCGVKNSY